MSSDSDSTKARSVEVSHFYTMLCNMISGNAKHYSITDSAARTHCQASSLHPIARIAGPNSSSNSACSRRALAEAVNAAQYSSSAGVWVRTNCNDQRSCRNVCHCDPHQNQRISCIQGEPWAMNRHCRHSLEWPQPQPPVVSPARERPRLGGGPARVWRRAPRAATPDRRRCPIRVCWGEGYSRMMGSTDHGRRYHAMFEGL